MEKTININGADYKCTQFFDAETNGDGVDVSLDGKYLGEIWGLTLPDDTDEAECEMFVEEVKVWLTDNRLI